jgi:uncharacterized protein (DUF4213/DUF364 family)
MDASLVVHERMRQYVTPLAKGIEVRDVRVGLSYTGVLLENGQVGVALTSHKRRKRRCAPFEGLYPLAGREARDLLPLLASMDPIQMAVALATVNALTNTIRDDLLEGDVLDHVDIYSEDRVGMVGHFAPMLPRLKRKSSSVLIFEQIETKKGDLLPEKEAHSLLPQCQVALITSSSIINHTIDDLLQSARSCREVVLLGASTPLVPEVFAGLGVTTLSGVVVSHPREILQIISEGGGMQSFRESVGKVNVRLGSGRSDEKVF